MNEPNDDFDALVEIVEAMADALLRAIPLETPGRDTMVSIADRARELRNRRLGGDE